MLDPTLNGLARLTFQRRTTVRCQVYRPDEIHHASFQLPLTLGKLDAIFHQAACTLSASVFR